MTQQLVDFILPDPVVLVGIEHRDENIQVREQVLQRDFFRNLHRVVRTFAPLRELLVKGKVFDADPITQRFEEAAQKLLAAAAGQNGNSRCQRQRNSYERRAIFAVPREGGTKDSRDSDTYE